MFDLVVDMRIRWPLLAFFGILAGFGCAVRLDVSLDHAGAGYFLKPMFHGNDVFGLNLDEKHFIVTRPGGVGGESFVEAHYGPFTARESLSPSLLQAAQGNTSSRAHHVLVENLDVSAHVVSRNVDRDRPSLPVLFHAGRAHAGDSSSGSLCLQVHARNHASINDLTASCMLNSTQHVCIAELNLPVSWWQSAEAAAATVDVFYSVYAVSDEDTQTHCTDGGAPSKAAVTAAAVKRFLSSATLTHGQLSYQELKEDQHVLVYVPQKSFHPGSKFTIPIKLHAGSDLDKFVVRVKAKHGLKVVAVDVPKADTWHVTMDMGANRRSATVTAEVRDKKKYQKMNRVQDVFDWVFEVAADAPGTEPGRLLLTLEYERSLALQEKYGSIANRVVARIPIQDDDTQAIVPVIKTTELMNTAVLAGRRQSLPMRIFAVSHSGVVTDVTAHTMCHSGNERVLKVSQTCNEVYVDGTETEGAASVSVIAKYDRHTRFLFFRVWLPQTPLQVTLSDNKLSQVKGWKVPRERSAATSRSSRYPRGLQYGLLNVPRHLNDADTDPMSPSRKSGRQHSTRQSGGGCRLRYQQAIVDVYARFAVSDVNGRWRYLVHRKALLRVTDLVLDKLRVADTTVAKLEGSVVQGVGRGRTEIQVLSHEGHVVGAQELKVSSDKVTVDRLDVDLVTGISMSVALEKELPGLLVTRIERQATLHSKYQEAVLDVWVSFSDGTSLPLHVTAPRDYFLDTRSLNSRVATFGPLLSPDAPKVVALGKGRGELLRLGLELGDTCQRRRSRPLAVSFVYIDVDLPSDGERMQSDAGHFSYHSGTSGGKYAYRDGGRRRGGGRRKVITKTPNQQAQVSLMRDGSSPLEVGMYVLLTVFSLAVVVFAVNCAVFVARNRQKKIPEAPGGAPTGEATADANDWVWIGRETLKRNAIDTDCSTALLPPADFNGNHSMLTVPPQNRLSACSAGSERNSVVSTYKGSECSIRITTNPLTNQPQLTDALSNPPPQGVATPAPVHSTVPAANAPQQSDVEWDYEEMGLSYDQLMCYFDNLKETNA